VHPAAANFQFSRLANPRTGPAQIADRGRRSLRRLAEWGVDGLRDSRLERATDFIEASRFDEEAMTEPAPEHLIRIGESTRTIVETYLATHASEVKPPQIVLEKFALAIQGADTPAEETSHAARDAHWELYVWGLMTATGVPCEFAEPPDLLCMYGNEKIGVAAKRIWSQEQAKRRLSLGAEQIEASGLRGFIAVNGQEYLTEASGVDDLKIKGEEFNKDLARLHGHVPYLAGKKHVLGLIVGGTGYRWMVDPGGVRRAAFSNFHQLLVLADGVEAELFANQFASAQGTALGRWVQENM
jgi:hypothetical protein